MGNGEDAKSKVLVVEDSRTVIDVLRKYLVQELGDCIEIAMNFAEAKALLAQNPGRFFVAILDLYLPDAQDGEVVDYAISLGVPPIILSAEYRKEVHGLMMNKPIVEYVVKRNSLQLDYLGAVVKRVRGNVHRTVLVVDDSPSCRLVLGRYLERQSLNVIEANSAEEAIRVIEEKPEICLVITDQNMGGMTGADMIVHLRIKHPRNTLAIIGVSASDNKELNALFLKSGANDFFSKPFSYEELFCRVTQNIDAVVLHKQLSENADLDPISNTFTRKYLMRMGHTIHSNYRRSNVSYVLCFLKIKEFQHVSDTLGPHVGEEALNHVGGRLSGCLRQTDIVARVGGAEFCVLCLGVDTKSAKLMLYRMHRQVTDTGFNCDGHQLKLSIAAVLHQPDEGDFEDNVNAARRSLLAQLDEGD